MEFTPFSAIIGGSLIGISSALMMHFHGRITGISGFVGQGLLFEKGDTAWRWLFLLGLMLGGVVGMKASGFEPTTVASFPLVIVGGLLVGFGTRMSNGCTSGHGVCGNARLSPRSIVATVTFISVGMITAYFVLHSGGFA